MAKAPNYTAEQEAALRQAAEAGTLNLETCQALADTALFEGKTARGLVAKARSMGLDYQKKVRLDKAGEAVVHKADLAEKIGKRLGLRNFESLAKAEKGTLKELFEAVEHAFESV